VFGGYRLALLLSGLLSLFAFLVSLYKASNLYIQSPDTGSSPVYHYTLYLPEAAGGNLNNENSFFAGIIRGAERAAAEMNVAVSIHSVDPLKNELEMASYTGVDGVIICPYLDDTTARRQLEKLGSRQIPVVLINHNIPTDQPRPFIGINNFDMGRRIGIVSLGLGPSDRETQTYLEPAPGPQSGIRLAVVYSEKAPGIYAERELVEMGISAALGGRLSSPIKSYRTNTNPLDAEALLYRLFRSGGEESDSAEGVNIIVFTDPSDTAAAAQTLVDLNLVGRLQVIGFGSDPAVIENIRKGIIACSVVINFERIGYEAVRSLTALRDTGYTSSSIDTGFDIITGSSLANSKE
jgi:ribose transport system substrate-binding protein